MDAIVGRRALVSAAVLDLLPMVRGRLTAGAALAPLVWFKSGGAAQWLFEPKDADDLAAFLRDLDPAVPVMASDTGIDDSNQANPPVAPVVPAYGDHETAGA